MHRWPVPGPGQASAQQWKTSRREAALSVAHLDLSLLFCFFLAAFQDSVYSPLVITRAQPLAVRRSRGREIIRGVDSISITFWIADAHGEKQSR